MKSITQLRFGFIHRISGLWFIDIVFRFHLEASSMQTKANNQPSPIDFSESICKIQWNRRERESEWESEREQEWERETLQTIRWWCNFLQSVLFHYLFLAKVLISFIQVVDVLCACFFYFPSGVSITIRKHSHIYSICTSFQIQILWYEV